jgi:hypothetical protein
VGPSDCPVKKGPAGMVENLVQEQMDKVFHSPDVLAGLVGKTGMSYDEIFGMFGERFWQEAKPAEFTRLAQLILDRITLFEDHIELDIKSGGLTSITKEFIKNEA